MDATHVDYIEFLFNQFQRGDERAFERIFKSNYNQLVGFCSQFTRDTEMSKGIAQEAFINLWVSREKIKTFNGIKAFLYTYAKSQCLNSIRHKQVVYKYEDKSLQLQEERLNVEVLQSFEFQSLEFVELENLIETSIRSLPEKCQLVFRMSRQEGKKNKEISEELNISIKSVEANITKALKVLRADLAQFLPTILVEMIIHWLF